MLVLFSPLFNIVLSITITIDCGAPAANLPSVLLIDFIHSAVFVICHSSVSTPSLKILKERATSSSALPKSNVSISVLLSSMTFNAGGKRSICISTLTD